MNLPGAISQQIREQLDQARSFDASNGENPLVQVNGRIFDRASKNIYALLETDAFPRFLQVSLSGCGLVAPLCDCFICSLRACSLTVVGVSFMRRVSSSACCVASCCSKRMRCACSGTSVSSNRQGCGSSFYGFALCFIPRLPVRFGPVQCSVLLGYAFECECHCCVREELFECEEP